MKRRIYNGLVFVYFFTLMTIMMSGTAYAYIDPATTSYVIQIVAGVLISCGVVVGIFWKKIRIFFRNLKMKVLAKRISKKSK